MSHPYCAVPLVLSAFELSGGSLWRLSSAAIGLPDIAFTGYMAFQLRALPPAARAITYEWGLALLSILCSLAHALAWPWPASGSLYLDTVWLVLAVAGVNFVTLIFCKVLGPAAQGLQRTIHRSARSS